MIVEDIINIYGGIPNYTKLAFNSLKMIQNDSFSANQTGDGRPLRRAKDIFHVTSSTWLKTISAIDIATSIAGGIELSLFSSTLLIGSNYASLII